MEPIRKEEPEDLVQGVQPPPTTTSSSYSSLPPLLTPSPGSGGSASTAGTASPTHTAPRPRKETKKGGSWISGRDGLEKTVAIEIEREEMGGVTRSEGLHVVEKLTIALLGGGATGKSSLIVRMLRGEFEEHDVNDPTLLDEYHLQYHFENRTYHLTILDTAGQEQYCEHRKESIEEAKGYLLVYDVTQRVSFEEIEVFLNELCRVRFKDTKDLPIVIVGNKGDVPDEERQVTKEEAIRFAEDNGCPLIEASAKTGKNVQKVLDKLLQEITYYHTKAIRGIMWKMKGVYTTPSIRLKGRPRWTKFFVVLDRENFSWFSSKNKSNPRGCIPLSTVVGCREAEKETQKSNSLLIKSLFTCFFYTDNEDERDMWINEIRKHASKQQQDREIGTGDEIIRTLDGTPVEEEINFDPDALRNQGKELVEVKAIRAYKSKMGSELSFTKGQIITVLKSEGDRYKGVLGRRKGWFPKNCVVEIISLDHSSSVAAEEELGNLSPTADSGRMPAVKPALGKEVASPRTAKITITSTEECKLDITASVSTEKESSPTSTAITEENPGSPLIDGGAARKKGSRTLLDKLTNKGAISPNRETDNASANSPDSSSQAKKRQPRERSRREKKQA